MNILQKHRNTYHKSESRLHHHSLIVAVGVALFATMAARNIADTL